MCVWVHMSVQIPTKSGESIINPGFGGCKDLFGCLEPNLGPLKKSIHF